MSTASIPLGQGIGYGVIIGLGALFALGMIGISALLSKNGTSDDNEEFTVAKRSLKTGLTAAGVVSSWTWYVPHTIPAFSLRVASLTGSILRRSTTLLSSCVVAYQYGVAGSLFYATCNSTQIMAYSNLAIQAKVSMFLECFSVSDQVLMITLLYSVAKSSECSYFPRSDASTLWNVRSSHLHVLCPRSQYRESSSHLRNEFG